MYLNKEEKEALYELLDVMTNRCPKAFIDTLTTDYYCRIFWKMFKKLRLELKGF